MKNIIIVGSKGFIGSNLKKYYKKKNVRLKCINDPINICSTESDNIFYCIGVTGDFLSRPYDTVEAHASIVNHILYKNKFKKFIYLSSTRIYQNSNSSIENTNFNYDLCGGIDLYNSSKIFGETICLLRNTNKIKIARISNVVGNYREESNFITQILTESRKNKIVLKGDPAFSRDYISIDDVCYLLDKICFNGKSKIYNVASGKNISNRKICKQICDLTDSKLIIKSNHRNKFRNPKINIKKIKNEFNFTAKSIEKDINYLIHKYKYV